ncbi:hypothetical protein F4861DRAFT_380057 [Xylaria intraflava]|nr:hypothetical protein F4861DRAFT_380057 [Xylaria intraflava]
MLTRTHSNHSPLSWGSASLLRCECSRGSWGYCGTADCCGGLAGLIRYGVLSLHLRRELMASGSCAMRESDVRSRSTCESTTEKVFGALLCCLLYCSIVSRGIKSSVVWICGLGWDGCAPRLGCRRACLTSLRACGTLAGALDDGSPVFEMCAACGVS